MDINVLKFRSQPYYSHINIHSRGHSQYPKVNRIWLLGQVIYRQLHLSLRSDFPYAYSYSTETTHNHSPIHGNSHDHLSIDKRYRFVVALYGQFCHYFLHNIVTENCTFSTDVKHNLSSPLHNGNKYTNEVFSNVLQPNSTYSE